MFTFSVQIQTQEGRDLITSFSMAVKPKDKIALIGAEGNGKSLFLRAMMQETIENLNVISHIQPQSILFSKLDQILDDNAKQQTALEYIVQGDWDQYAKACQYFGSFLPHLRPEDIDRLVGSFSGGEQVKLQIIRMMCSDADVYVFDEPTNNLDLETIEWFENWMRDEDKPILFVSHDITLTRKLANRILHFEQLNRKTKAMLTLFEGSYDTYIDQRERMIANQNQRIRNDVREQEKKEETWRRQYHKVSHQLQNVNRKDPGLQKKMKNLKAQKRRMDKNEIDHIREIEDHTHFALVSQFSKQGKQLIHYAKEKLEVSNRILAENLSLNIIKGEKVAIIGPNGVGKSCFIKDFIEEMHKQQVDVGVMHQDYELHMNYNLTPLDYCSQSGTKEELETIRAILGNLQFTSQEMEMQLSMLSGGQRAKTSLLKLIFEGHDIIVLDEPTRNLSHEAIESIHEVLQAYPNAMLCVTHDRAFIEGLFSSVYTMTQNGFELCK